MRHRTACFPAPAVAAAGLLVCALAAGCDAGPRAEAPSTAPSTALGCGMVEPRDLVGLLGPGATSTRTGDLAALRERGHPAWCRTVSAADPTRSVTVRVVRHPAPLPLPRSACSAGWVYAGTPDKYAPACQSSHGGRSRTVLLARWQEYVVEVTVTRPDRSWAGDPEVALRMTEQVATRLGVAVPSGAQSAGGSTS
ncbi:MAG: hypothetical protein ACXVWU_03320 [Nocardioides sp.]